MKASTSPSKTGYFLIELLIVIAFFAVAASMCVQVFVKSHLISLDSRDLSRAVTEAQSAAEGFKATDSPDALAALLGGVLEQDNSVAVYYDKDWRPSSGEAANGYCMRIAVEGGQLATATVSITKGEEEIYAIQASKFVFGGAA